MEHSRTLAIDGEEVTFEIEIPDQAMAVPEGGLIDTGTPFLGADARKDGRFVWSGVVLDNAAYGTPVAEQFTDAELTEMYRRARQRERKL